MNVTTKRMTGLHTGFLSPTGEFFPCGYMEHMEIADDILYSLFPDQEFLDPEEELRKMGWVDIHVSLLTKEYSFYWHYYGHLSPEQKAIIKPIVINNLQSVSDASKRLLMREFDDIA